MTPAWGQRWIDLEEHIAHDRGPLVLFALMLREELAVLVSTSDPGLGGKWDLVVSAAWLSDDRKADLDYMTRKIQKRLGAEVLQDIARILLLRPADPLVRRFREAVSTDLEHKWHSLDEPEQAGLPDIRHAFVVTSKRRNGVVQQAHVK